MRKDCQRRWRTKTRCLANLDQVCSTNEEPLDSLSGIASLSLTLTLSGCAWVSPNQWFGGNERCDPDDRSGGLSAACAKESLATQERSSKRLVCMGDDTDQAWICGNNMEEVLAQLAEQNPTVLTKNKAPSSTDTSTDLSPANTEALGPSTDANPSPISAGKTRSWHPARITAAVSTTACREPACSQLVTENQNGPQHVGQSAIGTTYGY